MKKTIYTLALGGLFAFSLNSCGEEAKEEKKEETVGVENVVTPEKVCTYELDTESVKINWTAFKLTEKVGVGGTFDSILVEGFNKDATAFCDAVAAIKIEIYTSSTNTNNEGRDVKIKEHFFGVMQNPTVIAGSIESIVASSEDMQAGEGVLSLSMNGETGQTPFTWKLEGNSFTLTTSINVNDWKGEEALKSLNAVCEAKHTGEDGVSITWPDVDISVEATISEICE